MPLYSAVPIRPTITTQSATFYAELSTIIEDENPYGNNIFAPDISTTAGNSVAERPTKLSQLTAAGVRIMGWLRDYWSAKPILRSNNEMTMEEKQKSFYWLTMHHEVGTVRFPNNANVAPGAFDPPILGDLARFDINDSSPTFIQNSPDFELNQVCKAISVPFEYQDANGRRLKGAILIGYVGAGGGE